VGNGLLGADWVAELAKKGITRYGGQIMTKKGNFDELDKHFWDPQWGGIYEKRNLR